MVADAPAWLTSLTRTSLTPTRDWASESINGQRRGQAA